MKKRVNNDIFINWTILRNEVAEDFSDAVNIKLVARIVNSKDLDITEFSGREDNVFYIRIPAGQLNIGTYTLILTYQKPDATIVGGFASHGLDIKNAFEVVRNSEHEDDEGRDITSDAHYAIDGATFIPAITEVEGDISLSWTNNRALPNPDPVILNEGVPEAVLAANSAATLANEKAGLANAAAINANAKAGIANTAAQTANNAADLANEIATHPPVITEGTWHYWNASTNAYVDTNIAATPYEYYLQNTTDDPVLTEVEWSVWSKEQGDFAKEQGELAQTARENIEEDLASKLDNTSITNELGDSEELVVSQKGVKSEVQKLQLADTQQSHSIKQIEDTLNSININQEATTEASGYQTVSLPKNAANGGMEVKLEGLTAENLFVSGKLITATSYAHNSGNKIDVILGNKYYARRLYQTISGTDGSATGRVATISPTHEFVQASNILSRISTYNSESAYGKVIYTYGPQSGTILGEFRDIMIINLTATFGAGNEPDLATCDKMFADYFEGTANFLPTGRVRSVDALGLNPTSLYLQSPELRSNGLVKDEIRKGANGYEMVKRVGVGSLGSETYPLPLNFNVGYNYSSQATVINDNSFSVSSTIGGINTNQILSIGKWYVLEVDFSTNAGLIINESSLDRTERRELLSLPGNVVFKAQYPCIYYRQGVGTSQITKISLKEMLAIDGEILDKQSLTIYTNNTSHYTLATPVITPIPYAGLLNSNSNGTVYHEPYIADAGVYDTGIAIQSTDYPISEIEKIIKWEDGVEYLLGVEEAVIAVDGLSFTHPDLSNGDLVMFTYAYDKESTVGKMTLTHYDSRYVIADTANGKFYKQKIVSTNGVPSIVLEEV